MQSSAAVAREATAVSLSVPEWILFGCDGHRFAFPLGRVREILTPRPLTRLPGCGAEVCGLINLRGRIVTVLDFGAAVGLRPSASRTGHRLLLIEHGDRLAAFAVDSVLDVVRGAGRLALPGDSLRALDVEHEDLVGIGDHGGQAFTALDPNRILARLLA